MLNLINNLTPCTKFILLIGMMVICYFIYKCLECILNFIGNIFKLENIIRAIKEILKIMKNYELKTTAGIINFIASISIIIITLSVFITPTIASILGFAENLTVSKIILVILTITISITSMEILYKFDKIKKIVH
jgi:hypothetical protein